MNEATSKFLANQLYPDLKAWFVSLWKKLEIPLRKLNANEYKNVDELLDALAYGRVNDGDVLKLHCKPSNFGPFLRKHLTTPFVGPQVGNRLGPPLLHPNPILGLTANVTSHLHPVGIYPPLDEHIQVSLYSPEVNATGFISFMPEVRDLIASMPAIFPAQFLPFLHSQCVVTGTIRLITPQVGESVGLKIEDYDSIRECGKIWYMDCSSEESQCEPKADNRKLELWGALYASGHLEIASGELPISEVVDVFGNAFKQQGFTPTTLQNKGDGREIGVFAKGIRSIIGTHASWFAIHMDAEIAIEFQNYRSKFDEISKSVLSGIASVCETRSVELKNPLDLDFTYTDSAESFSVLRSLGAEAMKDPLAIAIRDWHRKREHQD